MPPVLYWCLIHLTGATTYPALMDDVPFRCRPAVYDAFVELFIHENPCDNILKQFSLNIRMNAKP